MNHEDLTDANKDSLQSKDTDSDMNDSELESEGETEFQYTSEQSSSRQSYKQKYNVMIVIMPCFICSVEHTCVDLTIDSHDALVQCEIHCCSMLDIPSQHKDCAVLQATRRQVGKK